MIHKMPTELIITILSMLGALITVWVRLNNKIAALEINQENMKIEVKNTNIRIDKNEEISREDHNNLSKKLDDILKLLIKIDTEHELQKTQKK